MTRYALTVEYDGRPFMGWQRQAHGPSVQQAIEEAVFILVKAYDALGMTDLRDDADRVMRKNFPESRYLTGKAQRNVPWWKLWDPEW